MTSKNDKLNKFIMYLLLVTIILALCAVNYDQTRQIKELKATTDQIAELTVMQQLYIQQLFTLHAKPAKKQTHKKQFVY